MKKIIVIGAVFLLMVLLVLVNWDGFLNKDRLRNSSKSVDENSRNISDKNDGDKNSQGNEDEGLNNRKTGSGEDTPNSNAADTSLPSHKPKLHIGFLTQDRHLHFADSDLLKAYLEEEFDFNFFER